MTVVTDRPHVEVDPSVRYGAPTVVGRVRVVDVADLVWAGEPVVVVMEEHNLTRVEVLVACWYAGTHGFPGRTGMPSRVWRQRWGTWADKAGLVLWRADGDTGTIPDPPARTAAGVASAS